MDSEVLIDADKINKDKSTCVNLVYTRRPKKPKTTTPVEAVVTPGTEPINNNDPSSSGQSHPHENGVVLLKEQQQETVVEAVVSPVIEPANNNNPETPITDNNNDDVSSSKSQSRPHENGVVLLKEQQAPLVSLLDDRVKICLNTSTPKPEINDLKGKLEQELEQVRILYQKLQDKENEIELTRQHQNQQQTVVVRDPAPVVRNHHRHLDHVYQQQQQPLPQQSPTLLHYHTPPVTTFDRRSFSRVSSDTGRFRHLTVSVTDNSEYFEKEKRTPKANHLYPNSDFLLAKDRLPPESNKKPKPTTGLERHKNQVFRSCSNLLQRLMKHKHGWVFNEPVNAKLLGLHDYHDFIKHPMDLGTIKSRLAQNFYKVPTEFAEDVRLTFTNAMTYNPRGHDVYVMAEQLSNIFEERWGVIESDWNYGPVQHHNHHDNHIQNHGYNHSQNHDYNHSQNHGYDHSFMNPVRTFDRSQSVIIPKPITMTYTPIVRTPVLKKPKARDPNKRDMTFEEKQKLSANLQSLPSEKLDSIVQIIKKSNTLSQNDDEIEVDIDSVDVETLWELDRFVMNYRKNLSKVKRRAEIQQERALAGNNMIRNPGVTAPDAPKENRAGEQGPAATAINPGENRGDNGSRSSSSSSSSSDSSSSDSDSDSSSEDGSGHRVGFESDLMLDKLDEWDFAPSLPSIYSAVFAAMVNGLGYIGAVTVCSVCAIKLRGVLFVLIENRACVL
ncbi:transcription factor GTE4-like protein isoform X1 [Tanacetum coccineum]